MFNLAAGITVKDNGFCRYFHDIIDGSKTRGHVDQLDIRFSFYGGVAQRRNPHGIKLIQFALVLDDRFFHDKPG